MAGFIPIALFVLNTIAAVSAGILVILGKTYDKGERLTRRGRWAVICISVAAVCGICQWILNEQAQKKRDERQDKIDNLAIQSQLPGADGFRAKELLALERNAGLISKSRDDASTWFDDYLPNLSEKQQKFASAEEAKQAVADDLHLFWLPYLEVPRSAFRDRAQGIAKKLGGKYTESPPERLVVVGHSRPPQPSIAVLSIGDFALTLSFDPGVVTDTERINPALQIHGRSPGRVFSALQYVFDTKNAVRIVGGNGPFEGKFAPYEASLPVTSDESYIEQLNQALNSIFEVWLATALKSQQPEAEASKRE